MLRPTLARTLPTLAMVAALAACSDAPTSPAMRAPAAVPRAAFLEPGTVPAVVEVRTVGGQLLGGATVAFWRESKDSSHVLDNSAMDLDKTDGRFRVLVPAGSAYRTMMRKLPEPYGFTGSNSLVNGTLVNGEWQFPTYLVDEKPIVRASLYGRRKQPALGATLVFTSHLQNGYVAATATDGGADDLALAGATGALDGEITVRVPRAGDWFMCETKAPVGYLLADPSCVKVSTKWATVHKVSLFHDTGIVAPPAPAPM